MVSVAFYKIEFQSLCNQPRKLSAIFLTLFTLLNNSLNAIKSFHMSPFGLRSIPFPLIRPHPYIVYTMCNLRSHLNCFQLGTEVCVLNNGFYNFIHIASSLLPHPPCRFTHHAVTTSSQLLLICCSKRTGGSRYFHCTSRWHFIFILHNLSFEKIII